VWLCQAGVDQGDGIYELRADPYLLREAMPYLMHYHLTRNATDKPPTMLECKDILKANLDLKLVSFGAEKSLGLLADIMLLLVGSNVDGVKKSSLDFGI
jgi:hypothetical protein